MSSGRSAASDASKRDIDIQKGTFSRDILRKLSRAFARIFRAVVRPGGRLLLAPRLCAVVDVLYRVSTRVPIRAVIAVMSSVRKEICAGRICAHPRDGPPRDLIIFFSS